MNCKKIFWAVGLSAAAVLIVLAAGIQYSRPWHRGIGMKPLWKLGGNEKIIALTFDDGPSNTRTPALLGLLKQYNVKATFFMMGRNIQKYPDIARRVIAEGHLAGNHSWDHPRLVFKTPGYVRQQIVRTDSLIAEAGQKETRYFRPPFSSKFIILPLMLGTMNKKLVTGTYDPPLEYACPYDGRAVAQQVIENAEPGAIIYLHDGKRSSADEFILSVEIIIRELTEKGYRFVRVDYAGLSDN